MFIVAALLAVAAADSTPSYHPTPAAYHPTPAPYHPAPAYKPAHAQSYDEPAKYEYNYDVQGYGDYEPQFNAQEARDGYSTQGSYSVVLPDGRTQTVTYNTADAYSGNVAEVSYSGEAKYPEYHPAPAKAYKPAPVYKPAPTYAPKPTYN